MDDDQRQLVASAFLFTGISLLVFGDQNQTQTFIFGFSALAASFYFVQKKSKKYVKKSCCGNK